MSLDQMKLDESAMILKVDGESSMKRRLFDLGFLPGVFVICVLISPFHDPKAYLINGSVIALRACDAKEIEVLYEKD